MDIIDLTLEEEEDSNSYAATENFTQQVPSPYKKEFVREDEKPKNDLPVISQYEWVTVDEANPEVDYIKKFQENHKDHKLDYTKLNIESLDPGYVEPNSYKGNIIDKIMKSLAKDGVLKEEKKSKAQDDYDVNDTFVDDTDHFNSNMACFNLLTPAFDDFICLAGDIDQFKKSNYFDRRLKIAKKNQSDMKKQAMKAPSAKTAKKGGKDPLKRKANDAENRPAEEVKKVKKTTNKSPEQKKQAKKSSEQKQALNPNLMNVNPNLFNQTMINENDV